MNNIEYKVGEYVIALGQICTVVKKVNRLDYIVSTAVNSKRVRNSKIRPFWIQNGFRFIYKYYGVPRYIIAETVELKKVEFANFTYREYSQTGIMVDDTLKYMSVEDFRKQKPELFVD